LWHESTVSPTKLPLAVSISST